MQQQDTELLGQFIATGSHPAFTELVNRHINLVYWSARRQVRDAHLAEDITQAVFMILAQRAGAVRNPAMLGGWLVKTTRQVSCNAQRLARRRTIREQKAAAMNPTINPSHVEPSIGQVIAPVLDDALSRLRDADRAALVLRFLEGKSIVQVGAAMGVSEQAAQKRIARALLRLRSLFARRGIRTAEDAIPDGLAAQMSLGAAPVGLAAVVSANVLNPVSMGGASVVSILVRKTIFWTHGKLIAAKAAASITIVATIGAAIAFATAHTAEPMPEQSTTRPATEPAAPATATSLPPTTATADGEWPLKFTNIILISKNSAAEFFTGVDINTRRTPDSDPAGYIKGIAPVNDNAPGQRAFVAPVDLLRGKRIRLSAWAKSKNLTNWACIQLIVYGPDKRVLVQDDMCDHAITGTTDWTRYALVADIPRDAEMVIFGSNLRGRGELWTDNFQIELVGNDVPVTDDQLWHKWSPIAPQYSVQLDEGVRHEGRPTMKISSAGAPTNTWCAYDHNDRHPDKYLGKRIKVSAWIKSEGVRGDAGIWIRVLGRNFQRIAVDPREDPSGRRPIRGTSDWKLWTTYADVPADAQVIVSGVVLAGKGTIWLDQQSVTYELLDTPPGVVPSNK